MNRTKVLLALLALSLVVSAVAAPAISRSNFSGDQQYGYCDNCHSALSPLTVTMASFPSAANPIAPGATVSVWVNVSGSVNGATQMGALIASSTGATNSLPSNGGWTITSDPSGGTFNYYKTSTYVSQYSFRWTLTAPTTTGVHPLYGRAEHSGAQEYYKNVGPLNFNVQATPVGSPTVTITSPLNGATVSGDITITGTSIAAQGATISSVVLNVDGTQRGSTTSSVFSFALNTSELLNGPHTLQVVATDDGARTGTQSITVTVNNGGGIGFVGPVVQFDRPTPGAEFEGPMTITANVNASAGLDYVLLFVDSQQVANSTTAPFSWTVNTANYRDGSLVINVTAVDLAGKKGYSEITVSIDNAGQDEPLIELASTIVAGVLAIIALILLSTTGVMFFRAKKGGGA